MILCDREIEAAIDNGFIEIAPRPPKELWTSTAIDLTLDGVLLEWTPKDPPSGEPIRIRPAGENFAINSLMEHPDYGRRIPIDLDRGYELKPGAFVLAYTKCEPTADRSPFSDS